MAVAHDKRRGKGVASAGSTRASTSRLPAVRSTSAATQPDAIVGGQPLALTLDLIDEDPHQPRKSDNPGFTPARLDELAASIQLRGVKTPISVRDNAARPGRYLINHGARRFRAARQAGLTCIPAFIDNDYNAADQVVENLHRNELTAREIADYIGRELAKGTKRRDIASAISKSPAFVTQHVTLLDLPDPIAVAFNSGRVKDVTLINELVTAFRQNPAVVRDWVADVDQDITRGAVRLLRDFLDEQRTRKADDDITATTATDAVTAHQDRHPPMRRDDPPRVTKVAILVRHGTRLARLLIHRRPSADGFGWIQYDDTDEVSEADLAHLSLVLLREM